MSQALAYPNVSQLQRSFAYELLSKTNIAKGMKILDLGCGTGELSTVLAEVVGSEGRVLAIDPDVERIDVARKLHSSYANLTFSVGSSDDDFGSIEKFDMVFCSSVLHWIEDKPGAFQRIHRCLKAGGLFAFSSYVNGHHHYVDQLLACVNPRDREGVYNSLYYRSEQYHEHIAEMCNFLVVSKATEKRVFYYNTVNKYVEFALASLQVDLVDDVVDAERLGQFEEQFGDGPVCYEENILFMCLRK